MSNAVETKETRATEHTMREWLDKGYCVFLGIVEKAGDFQNDKGETINFHNFMITIGFPSEPDNMTVNYYGADTAVYKVKAEEIKDVFRIAEGFDWYGYFKPDEWLFKPVDVSFRRKADSRGNLKLAHISKINI